MMRFKKIVRKVFCMIFLYGWLLVSSGIASTLPMENLVLYYTFDKETIGIGAGTWVNDLSPKKNNGQLKAATWIEAGGKYGNAIRLTEKGYLFVPPNTSIKFTDSVAVAAWCKYEERGDAIHYILVNGQRGSLEDYAFTINRPNKSLSFSLRLNNQFIEHQSPPHSVQAGEWFHAAASYDGSTVKIYLNGTPILERQQNGKMDVSLNLRISSGSPNHFVGLMDEVAIFDTGLTEKEISDLMKGKLSAFLSVKPLGKLAVSWSELKRGLE